MAPLNRVFLYVHEGPGGRNRLSSGTWKDIERLNLQLKDGMRLALWNTDTDESGNEDNLLFEGNLHYDGKTKEWSIIVDESSYHHESDHGGK